MAESKTKRAPAAGSLFVVATPIGNLEDMTFRAVALLKKVNLVIAEDTRRTGRLLKHFDITTAACAMFEHNEKAMIPQLVTRLEQGARMALVSDAGTPTMSDPGYRLITAVVECQIPVIPIPGVSAAVAALSVSGLPTNQFTFIGFAERKHSRLKKELHQLAVEPRTLIFFESPRRIIRLMQTMVTAWGDRTALLAREMTKMHESYYRGPLSEIIRQFEKLPMIKGECTLVVAGATLKTPGLSEKELDQLLYAHVSQANKPLSALVHELAVELDISKNVLYSKALVIQSEIKKK